MRLRALAAVAVLITGALVHAPAARAASAMTLTLDARDVTRGVLHAQLDVPVDAPTMTMVFPKWVPGAHAPVNPVVDLVMLQAAADGARIAWQRDPVDLFAFHVTPPSGAKTLTLRYDTLLSPGHATSQLALIDWIASVLYPSGANVNDLAVNATLVLPAGWKFATALDDPSAQGDRVAFASVPLYRLIDSPVLAGANLAVVPLGDRAELDVASDSTAAPVIDDKVKAHYLALMRESFALFGADHWRGRYHFLMTATDAIGYTGLEHHESSWNGVNTDTLASEAAAKPFAGNLLTHEFTHSWNGKYRRPAGLARTNYQADEESDLLWVYEGLTQYYSDILAVRAGFWTADDYHAMLATRWAGFDATPGRLTRTLADTTFTARLGRSAASFASVRRGEDDYMEGELMWLDADTLIREHSHGARSLDTFARAFYGAPGDQPVVNPYTRADLVAALNAVDPYDWEAFFAARVDTPTAHPPLDGITRGGYAVAFEPKAALGDPIAGLSRASSGSAGPDWRFSLGARIAGSGAVGDVIPGSPAAKAGLVPSMTIVAIDGRRFSSALLSASVERAAKTKAPMTFLVENKQTFSTLALTYVDGQRLPVLKRATGAALIDDIIAPRAAAATP